jgi:hypothetical protein
MCRSCKDRNYHWMGPGQSSLRLRYSSVDWRPRPTHFPASLVYVSSFLLPHARVSWPWMQSPTWAQTLSYYRRIACRPHHSTQRTVQMYEDWKWTRATRQIMNASHNARDNEMRYEFRCTSSVRNSCAYPTNIQAHWIQTLHKNERLASAAVSATPFYRCHPTMERLSRPLDWHDFAVRWHAEKMARWGEVQKR